MVRPKCPRTEPFPSEKGLRQRRLIPSLFFNTVGKKIMSEVEERFPKELARQLQTVRSEKSGIQIIP